MEYSPSLGLEVEEAMKMGSYVGDGGANRDINIGFTPKVLWIYNETDDPTGVAALAAAIEGHHSQSTGGGWKQYTGSFQGIVKDGFRTGTSMDSGTNLTGITYFWIAQ